MVRVLSWVLVLHNFVPEHLKAGILHRLLLGIHIHLLQSGCRKRQAARLLGRFSKSSGHPQRLDPDSRRRLEFPLLGSRWSHFFGNDIGRNTSLLAARGQALTMRIFW